jgi:class 3 adenylate cyclase
VGCLSVGTGQLLDDIPATHYARSRDGVFLGYQAFGSGQLDMLFLWGAWSNVDVLWEYPFAAAALRHMASFTRVITFDKRGTGVSDRTCALPTYDDQLDDVLAVLDAVEVERVALFAGGDAAQLAILFAATYPERTSALVLGNPHLCWRRVDDLPGGIETADVDRIVAVLTERWGEGATGHLIMPSEKDPESEKWWAKLERSSLSPGSVEPFFRMLADCDVRAVVPSVNVPTLVMHRRGDRYAPIEHGRYVAERVHDARFLELEGEDHSGWGSDADIVTDELEEFLTGIRTHVGRERVLATLLFTDVVGSTQTAVELGDLRWRRLLAEHDKIVAAEVDSHRGQLIKTLGDGAIATFDGPARAVFCAASLARKVRALGFRIRAGIHAGEIEKTDDDIAGIAVHIASRVQALAPPETVLVSRTVVDLVAGSGVAFTDFGEHQLKGIADPWHLYALAHAEPRGS